MRSAYIFATPVILLVAASMSTAENDTWQCDTANCVNGASCSFDNGLCGWANKEENDTPAWVTNQTCGYNGKSQPCLTVNFMKKAANIMSSVKSPCLCATGNTTSNLSFLYAIAGPTSAMNCLLVVYITTETNSSELWRSSRGSNYNYLPDAKEVQPLKSPFMIVFEAKRESGISCGRLDMISIDEIKYEGITPPTTSAPTSSQGLPSRTEASSGNSASQTLGVGAVAGIAVGAVVIIAVLIAVLVYVTRRSRREKTDSSLVAEETENSGTLQTITNHSYTPDDGGVRASESPQSLITADGNAAMKVPDQHKQRRSYYEVVDLLESAPVYSEPIDVTTSSRSGAIAVTESKPDTKNSASVRSDKVDSVPFKKKGHDDVIEELRIEIQKKASEAIEPQPTPEDIYNKLSSRNKNSKPTDVIPQPEMQKPGQAVSKPKSAPSDNYHRLDLKGESNQPLKNNNSKANHANPQPEMQKPEQALPKQRPASSDDYHRLNLTGEKQKPAAPTEASRPKSPWSDNYHKLVLNSNATGPIGVSSAPPTESQKTATEAQKPTPAPSENYDTLFLKTKNTAALDVNREPQSETQNHPQGTSTPAPFGIYNKRPLKAESKGPSTSSPEVRSEIQEASNPRANQLNTYNKLSLKYPRATPADHTPLGRKEYDHLALKHSKEDGFGLAAGQDGRPNAGYMNVPKPDTSPHPAQDICHNLDTLHFPNSPVATDTLQSSPERPKSAAVTGGEIYGNLSEQPAAVDPATSHVDKTKQETPTTVTAMAEELYMNVAHDGVKPVPQPDSEGLYNQLNFGARTPDPTTDTSDLYDRTA